MPAPYQSGPGPLPACQSSRGVALPAAVLCVCALASAVGFGAAHAVTSAWAQAPATAPVTRALPVRSLPLSLNALGRAGVPSDAAAVDAPSRARWAAAAPTAAPGEAPQAQSVG
eukprot:CAMPEP_0174296054 /NCGR_PEP_ID=MMETSP0809-20121228/46722_1 /TAXON_ID=73025 ORGANISM="Eutreptiella gymnastica-like, Strain CCMP1594" /NCGR_SAMPLE_ID=MMETSP0809 /ASSEMBLY_ACC=CAM_ASM_000658 /LENGTH=113 /DNA_ID=CAMNT_0015398793 /DNA_START=53 /DNA_END=391 /DNA_ORIENTATION=+